jgi:arabinogalactan endo-1,4-beta-galactosidase
MNIRHLTLVIFLQYIISPLLSQEVYIGTTMGFTDYLENKCNITFKENNISIDPYTSIATNGANIARLRIDLPPYKSSYSENKIVDYRSLENVKVGFTRAKNAGLKTLLTFSYESFALEDEQKLNHYVAPLAWQSIADDLDKISDSVYSYTYKALDEYCKEGLIPEIVSIGNESSWHRLMPNIPENELPDYNPERSVELHNAGARAVREIAAKYNTEIKVCFHMATPATTKWWLETHWPYSPDFDIMGLSIYYGWYNGDYAGFSSLGDYIEGMRLEYGIDMMIMETAQLFREGGNDNHVDILGIENIPLGYPNPPTFETQQDYLVDITREVLDNGGIGTIVWGGEWVGCDCYIYADQWGKGSSWENKAFWDFNYNLHGGIQWMQSIKDEYISNVNDEQINASFRMYPNPLVDNVLIIDNVPYQEFTIKIFDIFGNRIFNKYFVQHDLSPKELKLDIKNGVYFLSVISKNSNVDTYKILKTDN